MITENFLNNSNPHLNKFWDIVSHLLKDNEITEHKDFTIDGGLFFIRIPQVWPLYSARMCLLGNYEYLSRPALECLIQIDASIYVGYQRKRFRDGSNKWCFVLNYHNLPIKAFATTSREHLEV